jgi:hypothetical protein
LLVQSLQPFDGSAQLDIGVDPLAHVQSEAKASDDLILGVSHGGHERVHGDVLVDHREARVLPGQALQVSLDGSELGIA